MEARIEGRASRAPAARDVPHEPVDGARRAGTYGWFVVGVLSLVDLVASIDRYIMGVAMVPLKTALSLTDTQLGLVYGLGFAILYCLIGVPLGWLAGSINRKWGLVLSCGLWTVATALCAFASTFGGLFAMRLAVGLGEAGLVPMAVSLMGSYVSRQQLGIANGLFFAGSTAGKAISFIGGGYVLAALALSGGLMVGARLFAPWQAIFLVAAAPGVVATLLLLLVREPARAPATGAKAGARAGTPATRELFAHVGRHRSTYALLIAGSCGVHITAMSVAGWAVSFYVRRFDMALAHASSLVGVVALAAGLCGAAAGGLVVDRMVRRGIVGAPPLLIAISLLIGAPAAYAAFALTTTPAASLAAYGLLHATILIGGPQTFAAIQHITPHRHRGFTSAVLLASVTLVSLAVGPFVIGALSDRNAGAANALGSALAWSVVAQNVVGALLLLAVRTRFHRAAALVD